MAVLDLGGTPDYWRRAVTRPGHVTIVNTDSALTADEEWITVVLADACSAVPGRFDLVVSNSLIEHISPTQRGQFAENVHLAAPRHWIQTPYRYFPIEPHWLFPGFQFLSFDNRVRVTQRWPLGHRLASDRARAELLVKEVELLSIGEMREHFPSSEIWRERFLGVPKSIVAILD